MLYEVITEEKSELERSFLVQTVDRELTLAEAARRHIDLSDAEVDAARITSYNVCYTKLLRLFVAGDEHNRQNQPINMPPDHALAPWKKAVLLIIETR